MARDQAGKRGWFCWKLWRAAFSPGRSCSMRYYGFEWRIFIKKSWLSPIPRCTLKKTKRKKKKNDEDVTSPG